MKVHILYDIRKAPWGGGNQFLRTLRRWMKVQGIYVNTIDQATHVLVNSKDNLEKMPVLRQIGKKVIHRIDGAFRLHRGKAGIAVDQAVMSHATKYADAVVFQSEWSRNISHKYGMRKHRKEVVINNCPDEKYFHARGRTESDSGKVRLITTSWSSNWKKGFKFYRYLDENLDFDRFEYAFAGNTSVKFKNIQGIGKRDSEGVGDALRSADIFVTGAEDDACSNSIVEALACGCVVLALDSGGSLELVKGGGRMFGGTHDILTKLDELTQDIGKHRKAISFPKADDVGDRYLRMMEKL